MPQLWNGTSTNPIEVFVGVNQLTANNPAQIGLFGVGILLLVWLIVFFRLRESIQKDSIAVASFVTFILASLLATIGIIEGRLWVVTLVLMVGSLGLLLNRT
jgi:hypothetical protein